VAVMANNHIRLLCVIANPRNEGFLEIFIIRRQSNK
jgi:hypothetical protein